MEFQLFSKNLKGKYNLLLAEMTLFKHNHKLNNQIILTLSLYLPIISNSTTKLDIVVDVLKMKFSEDIGRFYTLGLLCYVRIHDGKDREFVSAQNKSSLLAQKYEDRYQSHL